MLSSQSTPLPMPQRIPVSKSASSSNAALSKPARVLVSTTPSSSRKFSSYASSTKSVMFRTPQPRKNHSLSAQKAGHYHTAIKSRSPLKLDFDFGSSPVLKQAVKSAVKKSVTWQDDIKSDTPPRLALSDVTNSPDQRRKKLATSLMIGDINESLVASIKEEGFIDASDENIPIQHLLTKFREKEEKTNQLKKRLERCLDSHKPSRRPLTELQVRPRVSEEERYFEVEESSESEGENGTPEDNIKLPRIMGKFEEIDLDSEDDDKENKPTSNNEQPITNFDYEIVGRDD
ncbi:DgyrCDS6156 [Dimorphilus gyrociliatus]|uniref:DgyrCDS6156 n=1 Tax=Dimorphilus gyrociliatus TaxID=2664684 RepID=A0A7I8VNV0_9ANNE|nr:DgyrCDS6156 [Dimorphilus gyrociliatus]